MLIKKGYFGVYHNTEYKVIEDMEDNLLILTKDLSKVTIGFVDIYGTGVYTKKIDRDELSEFYYIEPEAMYMGKTFNIGLPEKDEKICLGTDNASDAQKYGFKRTDKYYYEKWVSKNDVKISETKKSLK